MRHILMLMIWFAPLALMPFSAMGAEDHSELVSKFHELVPPDTVTDADIFESNGFRVASSRNKELSADFQPSGNHFESLMISAEGVFNVAVEKGRPMSSGGGIGVFHRGTNTPMLTAADEDGDGIVDLISYSTLDEEGKAIREVIDYEADGQADLRYHLDEKYAEIWHAGQWLRIEEREGTRGVSIDGAFREIERVDGRPVVQ